MAITEKGVTLEIVDGALTVTNVDPVPLNEALTQLKADKVVQDQKTIDAASALTAVQDMIASAQTNKTEQDAAKVALDQRIVDLENLLSTAGILA